MLKYLKDIVRVVDRRTLLVLVFTSLVISLLEAASVSAVIPALNVILTDRIPANLTVLLQTFGVDAPSTQKLAILLVITLIFLLRALILSSILFYQSRLVFGAQTRLSNLLFSAYLQSRFEALSKVSTTDITRASTSELANLTLGVLLPMAALCSEVALVFGAVFVLLLIQPSTALLLIAATVALAMPVVALNSKRLSNLGTVRHQMEGDRTRFAQEITGGIREVKVCGMEKQLLDAIGGTNTTYARVMTHINFLQNFPRIYFEATGLCVLLTICGIQLYQGLSSADILTFLMLSGFAAFRALPSIAKIISQLQALRFYRPSLTNFLHLLAELGATPEALKVAMPVHETARPITSSTSCTVRVVARDASYVYAAGLPPVFQNVSFELRAGQIVGLVGPSGVGKSTLLDCIIGLRELSGGSITILEDQGSASARAQVAYVPQTPVVFDATVWRNLSLEQKDPIDPPVVDEATEHALSVSGFGDIMKSRGLEMLSRITESGGNLSGGQRQRLALTRALMRRGNLLVLDEATSALDVASEEAIYEGIRKGARDCIVIIVTHRPQLLKYCDQIIEMCSDGNVLVKPQIGQEDISS
jgi:ABC-type multidrug transport system fused ATPase/permease subunit